MSGNGFALDLVPIVAAGAALLILESVVHALLTMRRARRRAEEASS